MAEHSGLITGIGRWVLRQACEDRNRWDGGNGGRVMGVSVNMSARQLIDDHGLVATMAAALEDTGTDPASLTVELTEEVFIQDNDRALCVLRDLKALGVLLALDDFGTGYSSLSYLKRFPIDIVKVDRSFVSDLGSDSASHAIVYAVAELAHLLGMTVIAEGVETAEQLREVTMLGCDYSQGFHFGRAVPSDAFAAMIG